jgi:hypothetical protein
MHPLLLHQFADERVIDRRRSLHRRYDHRRHPGGSGTAARVRAGIGGILITVGTRVAGTSTTRVALRRTPT